MLFTITTKEKREDSADSNVSYNDVYRERFKISLEMIEKKLQTPPPGIIRQGDLMWNMREILLRRVDGNLERERERKSIVAQQCFIPTSRVQDFIHGMENGNNSITSKYVRRRTR